MNNLGEAEDEREYRRNKNIIILTIVLNICPVYAGNVSKIIWGDHSLWITGYDKQALNHGPWFRGIFKEIVSENLKKSFLERRSAQWMEELRCLVW